MELTSTIPVLDLSPEIDELWDDLNAAFQEVLRSGHFIMGPMVEAFEAEVAGYLGVKHAIGVNSGTDALVIGLRALGIGNGDEVITTPFSFFATAESISMVGAKPVFVDIDARTFNIDPTKIEDAVTARTKAILPVHLYGNPAEMAEIMDIAVRRGLHVIEDCAQSFGARFWGGAPDSNGQKVGAEANIFGRVAGTIGDVGAFSFFPSKNLGAFGDAGLIVTDHDGIAAQARMLRVHGAQKKYHNEILGYNSRMDSLQAALLRVKLPHIDRFNSGRRLVAETYNKLLYDVPGIIRPTINKGHVFHQYTVRISGGRRDEVQRRLSGRGINTMVYYPVPQDQLPVYAGKYAPYPMSDQAALEALSLPIWPSMTEEVQQQVIVALKESL